MAKAVNRAVRAVSTRVSARGCAVAATGREGAVVSGGRRAAVCSGTGREPERGLCAQVGRIPGLVDRRAVSASAVRCHRMEPFAA